MTRARLPLVFGVGLVAAGLIGCGQSRESTQQIAELSSQVAVLKLQAQATRDWTHIATLQASYGLYLDSMRWDDAADLFSRHAVLEVAGQEPVEGQDNIRSYLRGLGKPGSVNHSAHLQQPVIHIGPEGLTAKARGLAFESEYVKEDGVWKISKLQGSTPSTVKSGKG